MNTTDGSWVVFVEDCLIEIDIIYLNGMWGKIQPDPYGICTPGISTMILAIGQNRPFGCLDDYFRYADREPTTDELLESLRLWENAFHILEERQGWTGFVSVDGKTLPQEKACREIQQQAERIKAWGAGPGREKEIKGSVKRLKKVLHAFRYHPDGHRASELAEMLAQNPAVPAFQGILTAISEWSQAAASVKRNPT